MAVFLFGKALEGVIKMVALGLVNKLFGLLFGGLKFALIVSSLFFMINGFPITEKLIPVDSKKESLFYKPVSSIAPSVYPVLHNKTWMDDLEESFETIKEKVEEKRNDLIE